MSEELGEGEVNGDDDDEGDDDDIIITNSRKENEDDEEEEDLQHQAEDSHELEMARKEQMDLMAVELSDKKKSKGGGGGGGAAMKMMSKMGEGDKEEKEEKLPPMDKFQYLIGQSEVFAHFLAGE